MSHIEAAPLTPVLRALGNLTQRDARPPQAGSLLGNATALVSNEVSSLGDAAEELSLHMAERTENKHHAERKVKTDGSLQLMRAAEVVDLLQQCQDQDAQAKLEAMIDRILSGTSTPHQAASRAFEDVVQQYLGLQYAWHKAKKQGSAPDLVDAITDALADLETECGPSIRAGLNALGYISGFSLNPQSAQTFQQAYRDVVLGENTLSKTLSLALERFGGKNLAKRLGQLIEALGRDLAGARPSTEPGRLKALTGDMYQLQVAVTVLENGKSLADTLRLKSLAQVDDERLLHDMVGMTSERYITDSHFTTLSTKHGAQGAVGRVAFLTGVKNMLRELPVQVFADNDARQAVLTAAQNALDVAIDEEDPT